MAPACSSRFVHAAARSAARRPKTTVALWLALIVACVGLGSSAGMRTLSNAGSGTGESARADARLTMSGLQGPATENILVRSSSRQRTAHAVAALEGGVIRLSAVKSVDGPNRLARAVSCGWPNRARRRDAARRSQEPRHPRRPGPALCQSTVCKRARRHVRRGRQRLGRQRDHEPRQQRAAPGRADLGSDHAHHPGARVRRAGRRVGAAAARSDVGSSGDRSARARVTHRAQRLLDGSGRGPDRSCRRRRLLAVLHPPRAARAAQRGVRRRGAGCHLGDGRPRDSGRGDDGRDWTRRAAVHRLRGVHVDGARRDPGRVDRRRRVADGSSGDARAARRPDRPRPDMAAPAPDALPPP